MEEEMAWMGIGISAPNDETALDRLLRNIEKERKNREEANNGLVI